MTRWKTGSVLPPNVWGYPWRSPTARSLAAQPRFELRAKESSILHACSYVSTSPSTLVVEVMRRTMHELELNLGSFWAVHLRRGDSMALCDTSVPTILRWLNCSATLSQAQQQLPPKHRSDSPPEQKSDSVAAPATELRSKQLPAVVFTDDPDPSYAKALTQAMEAAPQQQPSSAVKGDEDGLTHAHTGTSPFHVFSRVMHADAHIASIASRLVSERVTGVKHDNFVVFAAGVLLQAQAGAKLERRRHFECEACARPLWTRSSGGGTDSSRGRSQTELSGDAARVWHHDAARHENPLDLWNETW